EGPGRRQCEARQAGRRARQGGEGACRTAIRRSALPHRRARDGAAREGVARRRAHRGQRGSRGAAPGRGPGPGRGGRGGGARPARGRKVELQGVVRLHAELDRALDDLSAELNTQIGPELSTLSGEFLASLTDGQYDEVQLDDSFDATVYEDGEPRPVL